MEPLSPQTGLAALDWALRHDRAQLGIVPVDWSRWASKNRLRPFFEEMAAQGSQADAVPETAIGEALSAAIPVERRHLLDRHVRAIVAEALGHPQERLDFSLGFSDLGVDSLTAVSIRNRLQRELGCTLGTTFLFDYPNLAILVDTLHAGLEPRTDPAVAASAASPGAEELAASLAAMLDSLEVEAS
jgi:acyl carrier protein